MIWELTSWNWDFSCFVISQPFRSREMRVTVLRNGTRVPKVGFAATKFPAEWDFWCEISLFHFAMRFAAAKWRSLCCEVALVCQRLLPQLRKVSQRLLQCCGMVWQQNADFVEAAKFRRPLFFPYFSPVSAPFDFDFAPIFFLQFLCNSSWFW